MSEIPPPDEIHLALRRHILAVITETLKQHAGFQLTAGRIREIEEYHSYGEATMVFRAAVNQVGATVAISFDETSAIEAAKTFTKKNIDKVDEQTGAAILDIARKMCSALQLRLKEKKCVVSIVPPTLLMGRDQEIKELAEDFPIRVPFRTQHGSWLVADVSLEDI